MNVAFALKLSKFSLQNTTKYENNIHFHIKNGSVLTPADTSNSIFAEIAS